LRFIERTPTRAEYETLCRAVGWDHLVDFDLADKALGASLFAVVAELDGEIVATARVVGDGVTSFYIQDVIVLPRLQSQGLGAQVMDRVFAWIKANAPPRAMVRLFTAEAAEPFYRRLGFDMPIKGLSLPVDKLP
jgi:GNAT superfamily N-acetyltransferase